MVFNTLQFVPFVVIVLIVHRFAPWRYDRVFLLAANYFFYASFSPPFVLVLLLSTVIDHWAGKRIHATDSRQLKRLFLLVSCCVNLGILGFFKYADFLAANLASLFGAVGISWVHDPWDIFLPVGISFYTFQSMSYTIDIYRGKTRPYEFVEFALFVSFFTQLVAGPIVRARDLLPQLTRKKIPSFRVVSMGAFLVILGYFKKIVIADNIAGYVGQVFDAPAAAANVDLIMGTLGFTTQIYCDFSGYSDIAIGLSLIMGLRLKRNFRLPYLARGMSDFWRRWHISLSSWIRDYVFIPLGGSRLGDVRTAANLLFTMTLFGLWHGASWMFVFWGAYHGVLLIAERHWDRAVAYLEGPPVPGMGGLRETIVYKTASTVVTFILVCVGWVFFRAKDFGDAALFLAAPFGEIHYTKTMDPWWYIYVFAAALLAIFLKQNFFRRMRPHWSVYPVASSVMAFFALTAWESTNVFIYFQF